MIQFKIPFWKKLLKQNFTRIEPLAQFLQLSDEQKNQLLPRSCFPLNLPVRLAQKIQKSTLTDPILLQFVPLKEELNGHPGFLLDPVSDGCFKQSSKLLYKYHGRVLLVCTGACAMHCRFCFRQNFDYETKDKSFDQELTIIEKDPSIHEVILSGGDPLSLSEDILEPLLERLNAIPHVKLIRFHTRFPIGIPERIDEPFLAMIQKMDKQIIFVIHVNHPRELDDEVLMYLNKLKKLECTLLSQSVLLKGVNDHHEILHDLCELLISHGIIPYYLHQLDRVQGAVHFEVSEQEGKELMQKLSHKLPGYAVPRYVKEVPGEKSKILI